MKNIMFNRNSRFIDRILLVTILAFLFIVVVQVPRIDGVHADIYFHIQNLPWSYWVGLSISLLAPFILRKRMSELTLIIALLASTFYVFGLPSIMYKNPWFVDTYYFGAEVISTTNSGYFGYAHSRETPTLAILGTQLGIVSGLDIFVILKYWTPILMSLLVVLLYILGRRVTKSSWAFIIPFAFISTAWYHQFHFSRQSYGYVLYAMIWVLVARAIMLKDKKSESLILLTFFALVFTHPASSASITIIFGSAAVLAWITRASLPRFGRKTLLFGIAWILWFFLIYDWVFMNALLLARDITFQILSGGEEAEIIHVLSARYSQEYLLVINLRQLSVAFVILSGLFFSVYTLLRVKNRRIACIFNAGFLSSIALLALVFFRFEGSFDRPMLHSLIPWSVLLGIFFVNATNVSRRDRKKIEKDVMKCVAVALVAFAVCLTLLMPLTRYGSIAFMHPPTRSLNLSNWATQYGKDQAIGFIGSEGDPTFFALLNDMDPDMIGYIVAPPVYRGIKLEFSEEPILREAARYKVVGISFRVYVYDYFYEYASPVQTAIEASAEHLSQTADLVYVSGGHYRVFYLSDHISVQP